MLGSRVLSGAQGYFTRKKREAEEKLGPKNTLLPLLTLGGVV